MRLSRLWILLSLLIASTAMADSYRRLVNFEWDPIEGASRYELEIKELKTEPKFFKFKINESSWNGKLAPGSFEMRVRALDYRGVPGDWSPSSPFDVGLDSVKIVSPLPQSKVVTSESKEASVELKWEPVPGSKEYVVEIASEDGKFKKSEKVSSEHWKIDLAVSTHYTWKVLATASDTIKSESVTGGDFDVVGGKITAPKIAKPENDFVREIKWNRTEFAKTYDVAVQRFDPVAKKWEKTAVFKDVPTESISFDSTWPGGQYRVSVKAKGDLRVPADSTTETFIARKGDRSPAAEFNHEVRKSVDRISGWYGIASYLITQIDFKSSNYDAKASSGVSYSAIGGTGRLGAGWFKEENAWGFQGIIDMSGFTNTNGRNITSNSTEASAIWRKPVGDRGEFRAQMGLYYKEHPVAEGDYLTGNISYDTVAVAGPHVGGEYWYSLTPKLGLQANVHAYYSMISLKTPNGQSVIPTMSNQIGLLGSYRLTKRLTGLMGIARRNDNVQFKSQPINPINIGQNNTAELDGTYLNFFAEYNF